MGCVYAIYCMKEFYGIYDERVRGLINHYKMELIPQEGAWFSLLWTSEHRLAEGTLPTRYAGKGGRAAGNAIVALVTRRDFSAMHRLTTAETWHFYGGDAAELLLLHPGGRAEVVAFGADPLAGQRPQVTVPEGTWMGARPARDDAQAYSFFGCTLAPAFDYGDYEHGYREELQAGWPEAAALIAGLTREDSVTRPREAAKASSVATGSGVESRVFAAADVPEFSPAPGVTLRELVGRGATTRTEAVSCACFRLEAGASSGSSRYHGCDEFFVVLSGAGVATLNGLETAVGPGSVVAIAKGDPHALRADEAGPLEFLAVLAPAFDPAFYATEASGAD